MDISKIIDENLQEMKKANPNLTSPKLINLSNAGVTYFCNPKYLPIFLNPVEQQNLQSFRRELEGELVKKGELSFWSYTRDQPEREYTTVIDFLKVGLDEPMQSPQQLVIAYHTVSNQPFLRRFLPIATELFTATQTWNPNQSAFQRLENKIDDYLMKQFGMSYYEFKKADLSKIGGIYGYRPSHEARHDFFNNSLIYLGALSSLIEFSPEEYFSQLKQVTIFPIKRTLDKLMIDFIQSLMAKPHSG